MTFQETIGYLDALGVEYNRDYDYGKQGTEERHHFEVDVIKSVRLPLTDSEWCDVCSRERVGGCCGTMGSAQGIIDYAFNSGGWIQGQDFDRLAQLFIGHDEDERCDYTFKKLSKPISEAVDIARVAWNRTNPGPDEPCLGAWEKIALVWHIAKDVISPEIPWAYRKHMSPLESAISMLAKGFQSLSFERIFDPPSDDKLDPNLQRAPADPDFEREKAAQKKAQRALTLARILPALGVVNAEIDQMDLGPLEGFALIDKEQGPDAIAANSFGLCIYAVREDAERLIGQWRKQEKEYEERNERVKPIDERIGIRRVRVSKEHGIEFLDGESDGK